MIRDQNPQDNLPVQTLWPGLLPWQHLLCGWIIGMLAWEWPPPATAAILLYLWALSESAREPSEPLQTRKIPFHGLSFSTAAALKILRQTRLSVLLIFSFLAGIVTVYLLHPQTHYPGTSTPMVEHRAPVEITGRVAEVRPRPGQLYQIILDDVQLHDGQGKAVPLGGKLLWNRKTSADVPGPGQEVRTTLRIRPIQGMANQGMSRSETYWARQGIRHRAYSRGDDSDFQTSDAINPAWEARLRIRKDLLETSPPGQGQAMLLALLMGDRSLLHPETMDVIQRASLAHSMALSGMHLGFVVGLGWLAATMIGRASPGVYLRLPRPKLAVLLSVPLVLGYLWLGQAVPSLTRAALMFACWGILLMFNRQRVLLDGLFLALLVILLLDPLTVFDLRLQLSALAVAGLALVWPLGREAMRFSQRPWWQKPLAAGFGILAVSTVATLALLPLQAWYFGRISPHLYLNVIWLPLLGLLVFPLGLTGLCLLLLPGAAALAAPVLSLACLVLENMVNGLHFLDEAGWLWVNIPARPLWPQFLGYWMLPLAVAAWWMRPRALRPGLVFAAVGLLMMPVLYTLLQEQRQGITLRMLDVGQGQAVLLELPGGKRWLVDGGGFWTWDYDLGQAVITPTLTHGKPPRLDGIALSHADFDHYRGLYYPLRYFRVKEYVSQGRGPTGHDGQLLAEILSRQNIPERILRKGDFIILGPDIGFEVLHPDDRWMKADKDNDASLVLRLIWKDRPLALLPGDIELPSIAALLQSDADLSAEVLIVPHHGSRSSFSPELYARVRPHFALVSTGFLNRFNHPHPEIVRSLLDLGIPLYNSSEHGAVTVRWKNTASPPTIRSERLGVIVLQP
ncbi:competence protein ComEC [Desulfonatronum thiosulfatophilum]|uniref:Competence protein ComEC n=1 Tax=Desulfonatronum thiosulfatophilum TaxID=617002 RepID=A0A1G6ANS1_9BACT|nr:DNA internalization-related competence protein ComEC/Rec2 [Desulfonatronum thiosulfatophilum]SDB10011.1 competence protein ComEC [Desulfonatronum thiosulfatophilum]